MALLMDIIRVSMALASTPIIPLSLHEEPVASLVELARFLRRVWATFRSLAENGLPDPVSVPRVEARCLMSRMGLGGGGSRGGGGGGGGARESTGELVGVVRTGVVRTGGGGGVRESTGELVGVVLTGVVRIGGGGGTFLVAAGDPVSP